jgi:cell division protein ZapA (FtsZ GTPase activity inhibitor)
MIPLSYHTIGFTAIMIMVAVLVIAELAKYLKEKARRNSVR